MRKLLFVVFCLLAMGSAFAQVNQDSILVIPKTSIAPTIDGVMDSTWKLVGQTLVTKLEAGQTAPDDWFDLFCDVRIMADDVNIYYFFNIQDDLLEPDPDNASNWEFDSMEFFSDADNSDTNPYDSIDDVQIRFNLGQAALDEIDVGYGTGTSWNLATTNWQYAIEETDLGWNLEVSIPIADLQIEPGTEFGIDFQLNDRDNEVSQEHKFRWWAPSEPAWSDASLFGTGMLATTLTIDNAALNIPKTATAPAIDAAMGANEWADAAMISVDNLDANHAIDLMVDEFDVRSNAYLKWDDTNLYLYFKIWDDLVEGTADNTNNWEWDSIELFFDADNSDTNPYDGVDDIQIRFNIGQEGTDLIDAGYGTGTSWSWNAAGVSYEAAETDDGWDLEIAMPIADLNVDPGTEFGFDIQLNDRDDDVGQQTVYRWWAPSEPAWSNAALFGTAELVDYGTAVEEKAPVTVASFDLAQNYPNPFNPSTTISYSIPSRSSVKLSVFDIIGKEVARLVDETQSAGHHTITFDGSRLASGVYFYRLETNSTVAMRKMTLMK